MWDVWDVGMYGILGWMGCWDVCDVPLESPFSYYSYTIGDSRLIDTHKLEKVSKILIHFFSTNVVNIPIQYICKITLMHIVCMFVSDETAARCLVGNTGNTYTQAISTFCVDLLRLQIQCVKTNTISCFPRICRI